MPDHATETTAPADIGFSLLWTIGFGGKRYMTAREEDAVRAALAQAITFLCAEASKQDAQLTAISSLARGGDVLFAETVRAPNACGSSVQWKCLLPFAWEEFIARDLGQDAQGRPLPDAERASRRARAEECRRASIPPAEVTSPRIDPADNEQREEAYLDCGYRIVDEADALVLLLRRSEIELMENTPGLAADRPGALSMALYAKAAGRPVIVLPVEADDPWQARTILNDPAKRESRTAWFVDPMVTEVVRKAKALGLPPDPDEEPAGIITATRTRVWQMQKCLEHLANTHQRTTHSGLQLILRFHLTASALAAIMATVLAFESPHESYFVSCFLISLVMLAFAKPAFAFAAWQLEKWLHQRGDQHDWIHARVLEELCRGAVAAWQLPRQPLDASDEEDFPKVKRLIRSLRLLREQDAAAATSGTPRRERETQIEADMRAACAVYIEHRLRDQVNYYAKRHERARDQAKRWRRGFIWATALAIGVGAVLAVHKFVWALELHVLPHDLELGLEHVLEAIVIIAPFVAAHCLAMMTLLDCRRRETRYEEMRHYLHRLAETLAQTQANPSRVRLVEHAERMMIEEQHEWFSVMRNLSL